MRIVGNINWVLLAWSVTVVATNCGAENVRKPSASEVQSLRKFLQEYLGEPYPTFERDGPTRFASALLDLNQDSNQEVIVYLTGGAWCGTGGCNMLVLEPERTSYRVVTQTSITQLPIRVLATDTNGWRDIGVVVAGGGIQPGYEAALSFDGKTYPSNPSVRPARRLQVHVRGEIVISERTRSELLYPNEKLLGHLPEGTEMIVPGESIGKLRLGMKKDEVAVSWQANPDSIIAHEGSCKDTEVVWFDNESGWHLPAVRAYVIDDIVYEITSEWDRRFNVEGIGIPFGMTLTELQAAVPDGELLQLKGSASQRPSEADELFWITSHSGIAFGLDYPRWSNAHQRATRSHPVQRIVQSVTVFRPQDRFQPGGCANPDQPLVPVETSSND